MTDVRGAADRLWEAWRTNVPCDPVRGSFAAGDVAAAYEVQRINTERQLATGDRVVGYKIGLTSEAVQRQLGVDQPDFGPLFASRRVEDGGTIDLATTIAPRVEAEIALVLGRDVTDPQVDAAGIAAATAYVSPALEIVDSRVRGWDITITDTVADFASGSMFVLGATRTPLDGLDLREARMELTADGALLSSGTGAATLGDPLIATAWLARTLIGLGLALREGDIILSGALGPFAPLMAGQDSVADIEPLGTVSCSAR
jgi:2-keto-4-pentenoate hydratase